MIKIYTVSSCTSCKKAKTWLNAHQLSYKEQNLGKEGISREALLDKFILTKLGNGDIREGRLYAKKNNWLIDNEKI